MVHAWMCAAAAVGALAIHGTRAALARAAESVYDAGRNESNGVARAMI
jgi:uncharacterized membrane protein